MRFLEHYYVDYLDKELLLMGGSWGHISHPFEDDNLKFSEMKDIISKALTGDLKTAQEKTDGQQLSITWKNGELKAARNKGQIKGFGANALSIDEISEMFKDRGEIQNAFVFAVKDLSNALSQIPEEQLNDVFKNGKRFVSVEVITPKTENVIPYDANFLIPHAVVEYDEKGNPVGEDRDVAKNLFELIQKSNANMQDNFQLRSPHDIKGLRVVDADRQENYLHGELDNAMATVDGVDDDSRLLDFKKGYWMNFITQKADELTYPITSDVLTALVNRWAANDKSLSVIKIKKMIDHPEFLQWVVDFDKKQYPAEAKKVVKPFETIFLKLGVLLLKNMSKMLAMNPEKSKAKLKANLEDKIKEIRDSGSEDAKAKLNKELERLNSVGGMDAVVPTEGITFMYDGKLYKLTGSFASINQIMGLGRYNR